MISGLEVACIYRMQMQKKFTMKMQWVEFLTTFNKTCASRRGESGACGFPNK